MCTADYFVHNACTAIFFNEAIQQVPDDSVVIEISPNSFLLTLLRRVLPSTSTLYALEDKFCEDNLNFFLAFVGR